MRLHRDRVQPLVADGSAEGSRPRVAWLQRCIPAEAVVCAAGRQGKGELAFCNQLSTISRGLNT